MLDESPIHYLDQLTTAVLIVDGDQTIQYINVAAQSFFHISARRAKHQPFSHLLANDKELNNIIQNAIDENTSYIKRQITSQLHDGAQRTFDFCVTPNNNMITIEIYTLDRFIKISHEENIYQSQTSLKYLLRGLAHEIKNPLAGIQGAAQLLDRTIKDNQVSDYTKVIIAETKRLSALVDRMLIPHRNTHYLDLNIHEVIERVYQLLHAEIAQNPALNISLERDYDPSIPEFYADKGQLIQAVLNIARNAVEALSQHQDGCITFRTRVLNRVTISNQCHPLVCEITISDNGKGIPSELHDSLFMPMISGRAEGSGLGLSIAQSIINQHRGVINFQTSECGTCFNIHLPLK